MPTVEEIRAMFGDGAEDARSEPDVEEELADVPAALGVDELASDLSPQTVGDFVAGKHISHGRGGFRYTLSKDGEDAVLHFGKYRGTRVSALARVLHGAGYLIWLLTTGVGKDLENVIKSSLVKFAPERRKLAAVKPRRTHGRRSRR